MRKKYAAGILREKLLFVWKGKQVQKGLQTFCLILLLGVLSFTGINGTGNGLEKEKKEQESVVTIHWFVAVPDYEKTWNPKKNVSDAKVMEKTGVRLDIQVGELTELDALIATDRLPDLITVEADAQERMLLENSGMVAALDPLFEAYAPDNCIPDSMKEWYRNKDGNWYAIASYYYGPERTNSSYGGYLCTHNNNYVREDLLRQTGVSMGQLKTKEGMLKALRAAKDLEYNGEAVIPYSGWWTRSIAEQFGMALEDEDGALLSPYRQEQWLEALLFGNQLYREGLMPAEEFTESANQRRNQVAAGKIFCCTGYANIKDAKDLLMNYDSNASMVFAGHIRGDGGEKSYLKSVPSGGWTTTLVNKDAEDMEKIIKFIAYMTTDEGILDAAPEIGAETYEIVDGAYRRKDSVRKEFSENYERAAAKYFMNLEFFVDWTVVQRYQTKRRGSLDYWDYEIYDSKAEDAAYIIEDTAMAEIKERIDSYYQKAEVEILISSSAEECRSRYEKTLKKMDEMGLADLEAYERERYQEAKAKLAEY